jgi:hypothetical protein
MGLDPRFVVTSDVDTYYVDKDSGAPLAGGLVTFYRDINRIEKKAVYTISGTPPNYIYTALPNPCQLSAVGTFQDADGNNIVPYYFPYVGSPASTTNAIDLYYITVTSSTLVPQLTREGWPNVGSGSNDGNEGYRNFIPNGQFISHTNNPPVIVDTVNNVDIQYYAQGGFSFRRTHGGASTFNNSFTRLTDVIGGLDDFPRYGFNFVCTNFNNSDQVRDWEIKWPGVNQFSSGNPEGSVGYTYFFAAKSNDSTTYTFDVRLIRSYGTGGSPSPLTDVSIGTVVISPGYSYYTVNIPNIPVATGNLGTNNDDYIAIALRGPTNSWAIQLTDEAFLTGNVQPPFFPVQTDADMKARGVAGWMPIPNPDGSDLYLTLKLTAEGMTWDTSSIGVITSYLTTSTTEFVNSLSTITNYMLCDGAVYSTTGYSPLGIPYARIQSKLWSSTYNLPITGTGANFVTLTTYTNVPAAIKIATNQDGAETATTDGTTSTGFTFAALFTGNSGYEVAAYISSENDVDLAVYGLLPGVVALAADQTSGFNITNAVNANNVHNLFFVHMALLPGASQYWTYSSTTTNYYVWYTVDGSGTDPAPGGTGILVPIKSTNTIEEVAYLTRDKLNGYQASNITTIAATGMTAGAFFNFFANSLHYTVWYQIGGTGSAPTGLNIPIQVTLTGTETAAQVATATQIALNMYQFCSPNLQGATLKGLTTNQNNTMDPDFLNRFGVVDSYGLILTGIGTFQFANVIQHSHMARVDIGPELPDPPLISGWGIFPSSSPEVSLPYVETSLVSGGTEGIPGPTFNTGGTDNTVLNYAVYLVINY